MPLLFPNLRITQVFGANTDVGKTLLTTALVRASAAKHALSNATARDSSKKVFYLKPVSTGPESESDVSYVRRHTRQYSNIIETHNLYSYREPMSPHLAAQLAPDLPFPQDNDTLVRAVSRYISKTHTDLHSTAGTLYLETAGGVHSPSLHSPHTQSTSLRLLRLPALLVASPHLGGISTTLTSYESLIIRGYTVSGVLCLENGYYRNHEFLMDYFRERGVEFWSFEGPPERYGTIEEDEGRLGKWYASVDGAGGKEVIDALDNEHDERIRTLEGMPERTLNSVWWPFTQHGLVNKKEDVMVVDSAHGDNFDAFYGKPEEVGSKVEDEDSLLKPYFDGSASWFTQSHGHASEPLTLAAAQAAGRYGHVLFPSGTHAPALNLAEKLLETVGKGWASRVFYSDNGSTGMEVALKMAIRAAGRRYGWSGEFGNEVGVIGLRGGYHGDTIGSMDASEASTYNKAVDWYKGRGHWISPPVIQYVDGVPTVSTTGPDLWPALPNDPETTPSTFTAHSWSLPFKTLSHIYDLPARLQSPLAVYYREYIRKILVRLTVDEQRTFGALVMEPTCLGAGGMIFVDPLFQSLLIEGVRNNADLFSRNRPDSSSTIPSLSSPDDTHTNAWQGLPVIYDEVFSGLHRFGYHSASTILAQKPDISVYAKILTGGLLPLSATLASPSIFNSFVSDKKVDALLHGHSYTANPIGCAVALKAIEMVEHRDWKEEKAMWREEGGERWSFWSESFVKAVSGYDGIKGSMALGTVLAMELDEGGGGGYSSNVALKFLKRLGEEVVSGEREDGFEPFRIHSRPLGNVVYIMTSLFTKPSVMRAMERRIIAELERL